MQDTRITRLETHEETMEDPSVPSDGHSDEEVVCLKQEICIYFM